MAKRRPPQEFISDIATDDDGIRPFRPAHAWTRDKLGILRSYLTPYASACQGARAFYFVDAMAGPGLYRIEETGEWLMGSTLIALSTEPPFARCLAMDLRATNVRALRERAKPFGGRAVVVQGDCNNALESSMLQHIPRHGPLFVLFDPEGAELHWRTIEKAALHRQDEKKSELLILLATSFLDRMLPRTAELELHNEMALNLVFPTARWREIWEKRRTNIISPEEGRSEYVSIYRRWLKENLAYSFVDSRAITRPGSSASLYHLIFASDHPAGKQIMSYVFSTMRPNEPNLRLPGFLD